MRIRHALLAAALGAAFDGPAHAAPLASASFDILYGGGSASFPGVGATGTATSPISATLGGGSAFAGTASIMGTPYFFGRLMASVGTNAGGVFTGTSPGAVGGTAAFSGRFTWWFTPTPSDLGPPIAFPFGRATVFTVMGGGLAISVAGAPWTAGATTLTGLTGSMTTLMITGMNALGPTGAGTLTLVSPAKLRVSTGQRIPIVGRLVLVYVPEPATAALLGAGALVLALLAQGRGSR